MTTQDRISLNVIIDRSGSMLPLKAETVGGFNKLLEEQKAQPGEVVFSLTVFDEKVSILHEGVLIRDVPPLTEELYWEGGGGWTALYDAVGMTVDRIHQRNKKMDAKDRPTKTLFIILTDGEENRSSEFTGDRLRKYIENARNEWKYEFTMVGANIDAVLTAKSMGFNPSNAINFDASSKGVLRAMSVASASTSSYREVEDNLVSLYNTHTHVNDLPQDAASMHDVFANAVKNSKP